MLKYNVLFGLVTKNVINHIPSVLQNVEKYASFFQTYRIVIIDASTDGTFEFIKEWCQKEPIIRKVYKQPLLNLIRPLSLTEARNMYLTILEEYFDQDTYLIVMDCDEINSNPVDEKGFLSNFEYTDWDAMFANQTKAYYDIYALRSEKCPCNYQLNPLISVEALQKPIDKDTGLIKVDSAFGGMGIYHTLKLRGCRYMAFENFCGQLIETCEHIPFHAQLCEKGAKLYINPKFINN